MKRAANHMQGPLRVVFNQMVISLSGFGKSVFGRLTDHYLQSKKSYLTYLQIIKKLLTLLFNK